MDFYDEVAGEHLARTAPPIQLGDEASFLAHPWVGALIPQYLKDAALAREAMRRLTADLKRFNEVYAARERRVAFTTIDGRVKTQLSFLRKLHSLCKERASETGLVPKTLLAFYRQIKDLCGVRFACPYYDEIEPAIQDVRLVLGELGYAINLAESPDKNYLDAGDERGYRSYHFYVEVPTPVDIYGNVELCLCEVQVRSELQHVWAVKSHNILYKPHEGWHFSDRHVTEDMKQLSNSLRAADQTLVSIRDRARGGSHGNQ